MTTGDTPMQIRFTKMHGCGNDYVYVSTFDQQIDDLSLFAKTWSDRHFGIGGDGVIFVCPSDVADAKMRMFNEDGSEGKMCGNGIRCVAKFVFDHGIAKREVIYIETLSGIKKIKLQFVDGEVVGAVVEMGKAEFAPSEIPVLLDGERVIDRSYWIDGVSYSINCVSMGNPHCVVFVDDVNKIDLPIVGHSFESNPIFPEKVNTEFVRVIDRTNLQMRVWERGSGETFACGTGACASVVAAVENGFCDKGVPVTVHLIGGDLRIVYTDEGVTMSGEAVTVFEGVCKY